MFTGTVKPKMAEGYILGILLGILIGLAVGYKTGKSGEELCLYVLDTSIKSSIAVSFCLGAFFALKVILCRW